jgi:hypothetical protein
LNAATTPGRSAGVDEVVPPDGEIQDAGLQIGESLRRNGYGQAAQPPAQPGLPEHGHRSGRSLDGELFHVGEHDGGVHRHIGVPAAGECGAHPLRLELGTGDVLMTVPIHQQNATAHPDLRVPVILGVDGDDSRRADQQMVDV